MTQIPNKKVLRTRLVLLEKSFRRRQRKQFSVAPPPKENIDDSLETLPTIQYKLDMSQEHRIKQEKERERKKEGGNYRLSRPGFSRTSEVFLENIESIFPESPDSEAKQDLRKMSVCEPKEELKENPVPGPNNNIYWSPSKRPANIISGNKHPILRKSSSGDSSPHRYTDYVERLRNILLTYFDSFNSTEDPSER